MSLGPGKGGGGEVVHSCLLPNASLLLLGSGGQSEEFTLGASVLLSSETSTQADWSLSKFPPF